MKHNFHFFVKCRHEKFTKRFQFPSMIRHDFRVLKKNYLLNGNRNITQSHFSRLRFIQQEYFCFFSSSDSSIAQ